LMRQGKDQGEIKTKSTSDQETQKIRSKETDINVLQVPVEPFYPFKDERTIKKSTEDKHTVAVSVDGQNKMLEEQRSLEGNTTNEEKQRCLEDKTSSCFQPAIDTMTSRMVSTTPVTTQQYLLSPVTIHQ